MCSLMARCFLLLAFVCPLLVGCDRPFVEVAVPTFEVLEPVNLDTVRTQPLLPLAFRASSFRSVDRVEVDGLRATFLREEELYLDTLRLQVGLNTIRVEVFDAEGNVGTDTLYAVYLPYGFAELTAQLPDRLGGHTATPLGDGSILIAGGTGGIGEPALDIALRFDTQRLTFVQEAARLNEARIGHTASLLPDGRVLILGGSRRATPTAADDLVTLPELYDPATGTFTELPFVNTDGEPALAVERTEHTTTVIENANGQVDVYLYGGLTPRFDGSGVARSAFMRTLRFDTNPDRLVALGPRERFQFVPIAGHSQTPLADVGQRDSGHYLIAGASSTDNAGLRAPFVFEFSPEFIRESNAGPLDRPRTDHAAAAFGDLVLVTGGRTLDTQPRIVQSGEVFASGPARFYAFPAALQPRLARWGHSATNIGDGRILVVGGFSASGEALDRTELFFPR